MMKTRKIVKTVLLVLLALILAALLYFSAVPYVEVKRGNHEAAPAWMTALDDAMPLNEIAVPGTHDSAANFVQLAYFSRCQASSIGTQLSDGFRYIDARLGVDGDRLIFYHGFCKCRKGLMPWSGKLDLSDVLEECRDFLKENPGETLIFAVKQEHGSDGLAFQTLMKRYIDEDPDLWYLSDKLPSLGECRGRIVLMRRYDDVLGLGEKAGIQMFWVNQKENDDVSLSAEVVPQPAYTLIVQDRYKYDTDDKWNAFCDGLTTAVSDGLPQVRLSFLSTNGTPSFGHPYSYARTLNKKLLGADLGAAPNAWVIVDFADSDLARKIYGLN